jgi:hypothetical protein
MVLALYSSYWTDLLSGEWSESGSKELKVHEVADEVLEHVLGKSVFQPGMPLTDF